MVYAGFAVSVATTVSLPSMRASLIGVTMMSAVDDPAGIVTLPDSAV